MKESIKKNSKGIVLMFCSALCACLGQVLWKISMKENVHIVLIVLGFLFYGLGALFMITSYKYGKLSVLQPIQSVNYIFSLLVGYLIFEETISVNRVIGVFLIILGVLGIISGDTN